MGVSTLLFLSYLILYDKPRTIQTRVLNLFYLRYPRFLKKYHTNGNPYITLCFLGDGSLLSFTILSSPVTRQYLGV